jgi:hypothetical protein
MPLFGGEIDHAVVVRRALARCRASGTPDRPYKQKKGQEIGDKSRKLTEESRP